MDIAFTITGFIVGALIGATGVGGGSLMTPLLVMLFGVPAGIAVGTDLLFASVTKGVGTALHGLNRSVSWRIVGRLAAGSLPASMGTLWLLHSVVAPEAISNVIQFALGFALVLTSVAMLLQPWLRKVLSRGKSPSARPPNAEGFFDENAILADELACERRPSALFTTVLTGFALGSLVTITSVGAGALGVMVLMGLYPQVRSVRIVGTDIAHAVPLTLVAGLGHATMGAINLGLLGWLLLGSIPGIALGSHLAFRLPERAMKQMLAAILFVVGGKLILPI